MRSRALRRGRAMISGGLLPLFFAGILGSMSIFPVRSAAAQPFPFSWDRATVYAIDVDRFENGDPTNDSAQSGEAFAASAVAGGDLTGIIERIDSGYFEALGVDVLNLSTVFVSRIGQSDAGLWPMEYERIHPRLGTWEEFRRLIASAHERGLRVVMNVRMPTNSVSIRTDSVASADMAGAIDVRRIIGADADSAHVAASLDALGSFFERTKYPHTNVSAAVMWLSDLVRKTGLDGYRIENPADLDPSAIARLKAACVRAHTDWRAAYAARASDDAGFWLYGETERQGLTRTPLMNTGLDGVVALAFDGDMPDVESAFSAYSETYSSDPDFHLVTSTASGPATLFEPDDTSEHGTHLLLNPGPVQIRAGQEAGLATMGSSFSGATRSSNVLDWDAADEVVRSHWRLLGQFRKAHPSVAGGAHVRLSDNPYAFYRGMRLGAEMDEVIIVMGASGRVRLNVSKAFPDDTVLKDVTTGSISIVSYGEVEFVSGESGLLLLEPM